MDDLHTVEVGHCFYYLLDETFDCVDVLHLFVGLFLKVFLEITTFHQLHDDIKLLLVPV